LVCRAMIESGTITVDDMQVAVWWCSFIMMS
jgi:hypothetical protein